MADLWRVFASCVPVSNDAPKSLIDVGQDETGTSVVRVYRMWHFDSYQATLVGALTNYSIARTEVRPSRSNLAPVPARKTSILPGAVSCGSRRAPSQVTVLRTYIRDSNQWTAGSNNINNWEFDVPMAEVWSAGYRDSNVQPLTARAAQGYHIRQESNSNSLVLTCDFEMEFTVAST